MPMWLNCFISPGQFSGEYAVQATGSGGVQFSLFAPESEVEFDRSPTIEQPTHGWIHVEVVARKDDLLLVRLPRATLENGETVTVRTNQIEKRAAKEKA